MVFPKQACEQLFVRLPFRIADGCETMTFYSSSRILEVVTVLFVGTAPAREATTVVFNSFINAIGTPTIQLVKFHCACHTMNLFGCLKERVEDDHTRKAESMSKLARRKLRAPSPAI